MIAANELTGAVRLEVLARDINSLQAQIGNRTPNKCMAYVWEVMVFVIEMRMVREIVDLTGRPHDRWGIINVGQITNPQLSQCFPGIDNNVYWALFALCVILPDQIPTKNISSRSATTAGPVALGRTRAYPNSMITPFFNCTRQVFPSGDQNIREKACSTCARK